MASVSEMTDRYEAEGLLPASSSLTVRRMRDSDPDLLPPTMKGASKNAPQIDPRGLTNFILANGAHLPIDAAAAVKTLRHLVGTSFEVLSGTTATIPPKGAVVALNDLVETPLGQFLDAEINFCGDKVQRQTAEGVIGHDWTLSLCVEGKFATISQRVDNEVWTVTFGDRAITERAYRIVALPYRVITIAGELWQNTRERRALTPQIFETEDAETLPGVPAP
jgi:hypothetical protein